LNKNWNQLSPLQEGAIGSVIGLIIGALLNVNGLISVPAIGGVALGIGVASWFNARRRARNKDKDND
jgi:hypothetical protein